MLESDFEPLIQKYFYNFVWFVFLSTLLLLAFLFGLLLNYHNQTSSATALEHVFKICSCISYLLHCCRETMKWISDGVSILHCIKTYCKSVVTLISLIYLPLFDYCLCSIMAKI